MAEKNIYRNPNINLEKYYDNSLKINFIDKNLIIGKSFFKNNTIYLNNINKTIFYFIKNYKN